MSIITALNYCLWLIGYMFLAGAVYDIFYFKQKTGKYGKIRRFISDFAAVGILSTGWVWMIIELGGVFRWYVIASSILGIGCYYFLFHKLIWCVYTWLGRILGQIWRLLTLPMRKIGGGIKKSYKKLKKNRKKFIQNTGNSAEDVI